MPKKKKASEVTNADRHVGDQHHDAPRLQRNPLYFPQPYAPSFDWDVYIASIVGLSKRELAMHETLKAVLVRLRFRGELRLDQKDRDRAKQYDLTIEGPEKGVLTLCMTRAGDQ